MIDEARQDAAGDEIRSADVDVEDAVPLLLIDVEEASRRRDAGVVDERRDRRQVTLDRRDRRIDLVVLGHITAEPDGLPAVGISYQRRRLSRSAFVEVQRGDAPSCSREPQAGLAADAAGRPRSGDDHCAVLGHIYCSSRPELRGLSGLAGSTSRSPVRRVPSATLARSIETYRSSTVVDRKSVV